jgi:F0F1-type ATP synthase assembly protein I
MINPDNITDNELACSKSQLAKDTGAAKILMIQSLLVCGTAWIFYSYQELLAAQAALYGGSIVMLNVWLMKRWLKIAIAVGQQTPGKEINILYLAAIQRFILTLVLLAIGMGSFQFPPIPLLLTFALAHLGYFFGGIRL